MIIFSRPRAVVLRGKAGKDRSYWCVPEREHVGEEANRRRPCWSKPVDGNSPGRLSCDGYSTKGRENEKSYNIGLDSSCAPAGNARVRAEQHRHHIRQNYGSDRGGRAERADHRHPDRHGRQQRQPEQLRWPVPRSGPPGWSLQGDRHRRRIQEGACARASAFGSARFWTWK